MKVDSIIKLENGKKYLLLLKSELTLDGYFLAVLLDEKEEPTSTYTIFKEIERDGRLIVKRIEDPLILNELLADYQNQYEDMLDE